MGMSLITLNHGKEVTPCEFDISGIREAVEEIRDAKNEVGGELTFRIKVAAGGGKAFNIETGDESMDTSVTTFSGVIIHNHKCNAYFDESTNGNTPPICASSDGAIGTNRESGECRDCASCPMNEYGSSSKGRGKACKNMHRLFVLTEGCPVPFVLSLPPTSLKAWQTYRTATLAMRKLKPYEAVTEFSLTSETSESGNKYSVVKFKLLGALVGPAKATASMFAEGFKPAVEVSGEDYNREAGNVN